MFARTTMILLSGAIGLTLTGCSATSPTMRAQSPNASFASYGSPMEGGWDSCDAGGMSCDCQSGACPPGAMCPPGAGACPTGSCRGGKCHGQCLNLPFHPVHRNFHSYQVPRGLSYPQDDAPPASYQYPYYTTRGPTDFFME